MQAGIRAQSHRQVSASRQGCPALLAALLARRRPAACLPNIQHPFSLHSATQLLAISRINESNTPSSYQAAALDAAQPLRPAGVGTLGPGARTAQQETPSSWQSSPSNHIMKVPADAHDVAVSGPQHEWDLADQLNLAPAQSPGQQRHIHVAFSAFFCYLGLMAAAATNPDWYLDVATFGGLWGVLWAASIKMQPSVTTVVLICLLPVMHLSGALGMYHWEIGNLSWDVLVHITNGFIGTLLFASVLGDMAAASASNHMQDSTAHTPQGTLPAQHNMSDSLRSHNISDSGRNSSAVHMAASATGVGRWQERAWGVLKVTGLLLLSTSLIEVVEAAGGQLAGHAGEGIFLRGPGDFCTASLPCSDEVDTAKDMLDNIAGMGLALLALATRGKGSTTSMHGTGSGNNQQA